MTTMQTKRARMFEIEEAPGSVSSTSTIATERVLRKCFWLSPESAGAAARDADVIDLAAFRARAPAR